jgi:hypothetical protein
MTTQQRMPVVNGDDGSWGDILNQYLLKEHYNGDANVTQGTSTNGGHQTITVRAGTATAGTAPLKFASGTLLTVTEAGVIEFNTDKLYFTQTTSTTRNTIAAYATAGTTGDIYFRNGSANFTALGIGGTNNLLTVTGGVPVWTASIAESAVTNLTTDLATHTAAIALKSSKSFAIAMAVAL